METNLEGPHGGSRKRGSPAEWLRAEYDAKRKKNPRYSRRAFSKFLTIPSGRLSELIEGKRPVTERTAQLIAKKLSYSPIKEEAFLKVVRTAKFSVGQAKALVPFRQPSHSDDNYAPVSEDILRVISDWYHLGLLNVIRIDGCDFRPSRLALRLGISAAQVSAALRRLERLGLIRREGKRIVRTENQIKSTHEIPSPALRKVQRQFLEKAIISLEEEPIERRDVTSMTMAIDPTRLPEAKLIIKNFRRTLADLMEAGEKKEVYTMCLSLFPLTRPEAR